MNRNDAKAAVGIYRQGLLAGTWTLDNSRRILNMQDDPSDLLALIKEANKDPKIKKALRKILPKEDDR